MRFISDAVNYPSGDILSVPMSAGLLSSVKKSYCRYMSHLKSKKQASEEEEVSKNV